MSPRDFPARSRLEIVDDDDRFTRPTDDPAPSPTETTKAPTRARRTPTATKATTSAKAPAKAPARKAPARTATTPATGTATPRRNTTTTPAKTPAKATAKTSGGKASTTKAAAPAEVAPDPASFAPAPRVAGMGTSAIQAYVRQDVRDRVNGVVTAAQLDEDLAGLDSLTAFVEWALDRAVTHVERTFNKGEPYPPPRRLRKAPRS